MIPATVASERDRANVTLFPRQRFCTHHDRNGIEAFGWLASRDAVISGDKRERDVICTGIAHRKGAVTTAA
jgi:hypothetical protein